MTMRMLIDARHREETRVAVVKGTRIEEFDFESAERKQLKGNIYLAKVTRVEPSLQAAFVDYGGNRHGFLAFSEIHPDYYQIPKEDRDALLAEEAEHAAEEAALRAGGNYDDDEDGDEDDHHDEHGDDDVEMVERPSEDEDEHDDGEAAEGEGDDQPRRRKKGASEDPAVEALRQRRLNLRRRYKIQDVIRRRQVLLVQVVKEERGNKGAALTTYLSLAGRYCVLMPNTAHGGGISRKISNAGDRKRLKTIMADLQLPPTMGCIVRTAGLQRTKVEIKRDFDYLARLWDGIREETLKSSAPALVYGDSDLMKRAIRDIYNKDIDEVIVEGPDGYRQAKEFMRLLMPSHARRVKHYSDAVPLFQRHQVEDQLAAMYHPVVQLKSGGYLVINPTEALVSIDINSGRSTREHNIEQTATQTNLEAAAEIARQLRLRDMAGLVVIDFIDMDHGSNVRKVEKAMKEALKNDRARIQVGRISAFGLMEMSRQRLRTGVLEASTRQCPHCEGTGLVRTASSAGLSALRMIEDEAARGRGSQLLLRASQEAAFYVLNKKRGDIAEIEERYGVTVEVTADGELEGARMAVEAAGPPPAYAPRFDPVVEEPEDDFDDIEEEEEIEEEAEAETVVEARRPRERAREESESDGEGEGGARRRRRRRGRRGRARDEGGSEAGGAEQDEAIEQGADTDQADGDGSGASEAGFDDLDDDRAVYGPAEGAPVRADRDEAEGRRKRRRRGRRGGRRDAAEATGEPIGASEGAEAESADSADDDAMIEAPQVEAIASETPPLADDAEVAKPKRTRRKKGISLEAPVEAGLAPDPSFEPAIEPATEEAAPKPKRTRRKKGDAGELPAIVEEAAIEPVPVEALAVEEAQADAAPVDPVAEKPKRPRTRKKAVAADAAPAASVSADVEGDAVTQDLAPLAIDGGGAAPADDAAPGAIDDPAAGQSGPPRRGWWQRTFGA